MSDSGRWQTIEHTGDLAVTMESSSLEGLFATAALALARLLLGEESGAWRADADAVEGTWREVRVESSDRTALLVDWLRELLYLQLSEEAVISSVEVRELAEWRIVGRVGLTPMTEEANIERELKAVTYHDAESSERDGTWFARVVFDI